MLVGTGSLPKFAETLFHTTDGRWLIPTAEVPVTNMYRDEILDDAALPIAHAAYSPCFRNEQFSAGRDVRGIKRGYQFDKVEMVRFERPEASWDALRALLEDALALVRALGLRYRVLSLASGDLTFSSAMTYDIEIWAPAPGSGLEVSSVSNFTDFQARRANLRFRNSEGSVEHLHTLNGSGLALPRLVATILEQYQLPDGRVEIPPVLQPYLLGQEALDPIGRIESGRQAGRRIPPALPVVTLWAAWCLAGTAATARRPRCQIRGWQRASRAGRRSRAPGSSRRRPG